MSHSTSFRWWLVTVSLAATLALTLWLGRRSSELVNRLKTLDSTPAADFAEHRIARAPMPRVQRRRLELPMSSLPESSAPWPDAGNDAQQPFDDALPENMPELTAEAAELANHAVSASESNDFATAVALLREALEIDPHHPLLIRNLQMSLLNWGIVALNDERVTEGLQHLEDSESLGQHPAVLRALGAAYLRLDRSAEAASALESALSLQPGDAQTMFMLAQAYADLDRRAEALDLLLRARERGMHGPMLERLADRLSREVDAEWDYVRSETEHFNLDHRDDVDPEVVNAVAATLEEAFASVGARLDFYPSGKTRAVLYPQEDFHHFTQMPDWIAGVFDGRIKIPVRGLSSGNRDLARVIRHEYAHRVIVEAAGRSVPVWLNEGIAMWAEDNPEFRSRWAVQELDGRPLLDITQITGPLAALGQERARIAYAQSFLAVAHLADRYGDRSIAALLAALGESQDLDEAARQVFRTDLRAVLATYFQNL